MTKQTLLRAREEARRFLAKGDTFLERAKDDEYAYMGCRESGAVKRASLDLTRALADLRRYR